MSLNPFPTISRLLQTVRTQWLHEDTGLYRINQPWFGQFLAYIDYTLFIYSLFVLGLWFWDYGVSSLPDGLFDVFYFSLWVAVGADFLLRVSYSKNIIGYLQREWFTVFIVLFPVLQPLRIFGISRFVILVFSKLLYTRFSFIRESRILEILLVSIVVSILSADLFLLFESDLPNSKFTQFSDALWFSVVTVATVGYGDIVPISVPGRILATFLILFGVSVFGLITAGISSYIITRKLKTKQMHGQSLHVGMFDTPLLQLSDMRHDEELLRKDLETLKKKVHSIESLLQDIHRKLDA